MTLYATGARRAEVAALKVSDIDSQRMVVHIHGGKGRKGPGRDAKPGAAPSAAHLLAWTSRIANHVAVSGQPVAYLKSPCHDQGAVDGLSAGRGSRRSGTQEHPSAHPLGTASQLISSKLARTFARSKCCSAHRDLEETTIYLHLSSKHLSATSSPLDALALVPQGEALRSA